mgnify:CR=1 FL=1
MADSFGKKDREKKRKKRRENKAEKKAQRKAEGSKGNDIMYVDEFGNFTETAPDLNKKSKINEADIEISVPKKEREEEESAIKNGRVKFFNTEKGYGFILEDITGKSYFVHSNNLIDEIADNDKVSFEVGDGPKGPVALEVRLT